MKWVWRIASAVLVVVIAACAETTGSKPIKMQSKTVTHLRIKSERGPIRRVAIEEYVRGTIIAEFDPPSGDPSIVEQMLEVQAVIARTYAVAHLSRHSRDGFDLCSSTHCQLYQPERLKGSMWRTSVDRAAKRTAGVVLWYQMQPARALFHADCGGHTSAAGDVWEGPSRPYLAAKKDDGAADSAHMTWRFDIDADALVSALNADPQTRVGQRLNEIRVTHRDGAGRASRIALLGARNQSVRGEGLRTVLNRRFGVTSIRSTKFDVQRTGNRFLFVGSGYGHGVGLCQSGAYARLNAGARPEQVLARYYPGTRLVGPR